MPDIKIRYATKDDCKELEAVISSVIQNTPYYNDPAKQNEIKKFRAEKLASNIEKDRYSAIIAIDDNKILGFCLSRYDDGLIWLQWFGILASARNRNISNLLLNELEKTIAPRSCHKIWCDCNTLNKASIHILTNRGFKQLVTIPNHWYGQDSIFWEKEIAQSVGVQPAAACQPYISLATTFASRHPVAYLLNTVVRSIAWYVRGKRSIMG